MVSLNFGQDNIYMDDKLHSCLLEKKNDLQKKDEHVIVVLDGAPGVGKSSLAQQCAAVIDDDFPTTASQKIHNTVDSFIDFIVKCPKKKGGVAAILDEGLNGANAKRAMSNLNIKLQSVLAEIRQKNMALFICLPFIFELDKSIAIGLSDALIHCYKNKNRVRYFRFYGRKAKTSLYLNPNNKKFYQYNTHSNFYGRMGQGYVMNEVEYRKFKEQGLKKYITKDSLKILSPEEMVKQREGDLYAKLQAQGFSLREMESWGLGSREYIRRHAAIANHEVNDTDLTTHNPLVRREVEEKND